MTMRRRRRLWLLWGVAVCLGWAVGWVVLPAPGHAEERITDETIAAQLRQSHSVMKDQRQRIQTVLDGFLMGDLEAVRRQTAALLEGVQAASRALPPKPGKEADQWQAMADIMRRANLMQLEVERGRYDAAYQHFSAMTYQCMKCHQARRDWGTFRELKPAVEPAAGADEQRTEGQIKPPADKGR